MIILFLSHAVKIISISNPQMEIELIETPIHSINLLSSFEAILSSI
jgi:hypothetical protein